MGWNDPFAFLVGRPLDPFIAVNLRLFFEPLYTSVASETPIKILSPKQWGPFVHGTIQPRQTWNFGRTKCVSRLPSLCTPTERELQASNPLYCRLGESGKREEGERADYTKEDISTMQKLNGGGGSAAALFTPCFVHVGGLPDIMSAKGSLKGGWGVIFCMKGTERFIVGNKI